MGGVRSTVFKIVTIIVVLTPIGYDNSNDADNNNNNNSFFNGRRFSDIQFSSF